MPSSPAAPITINLALQGGGSHGAFTWGVLDALLQDEGVFIDGLSGTSAGGMNAALVAQGLASGGREAARELLETFWRAVSRRGCFSPYHGLNALPSMAALGTWLDTLSRMASPYVLNPLNINPLRDLVEEVFCFDTVRACDKVRLFVSATNVRSNRLHVFDNEHMSADVLLASACLPHLHHAVEVNGEWYWDGGFMGNPVLEPLVDLCRSTDIVIVQINPTRRERVPRTADEILDRLNEITFNASLMREIRTIARVTAMVETGVLPASQFDCTYFHLIDAQDQLHGLGATTKLDASWSFLQRLKTMGRERAQAWLSAHRGDVGRRTSLDLDAWRTTDVEPCAGPDTG